MAHSVRRRELLAAAGALVATAALPGCTLGVRDAARGYPPASKLEFPPLRAGTDRITRITVCTRPFRAQGPRLDVEQIGQKYIVHNYGHGGSGWSLSWGSSGIAVQKAMATGERDVAVIGCGALGLTSALLLQRAGAHVTIYAKDLPPNVRSSLATGLWTPDSRICFEKYATPSFKQTWQQMARASFQTYQNLLGLPGAPVEFIDSFIVSDNADTSRHHGSPTDERPPFAELQRELIGDLIPKSKEYGPGSHPFDNRYMRRNTLMMFNITSYSRLLMSDFIANGGKIEIAEFHTPGDFAALRQRTLVNATGYGSLALFGDRSITPVRGQLTRLIPQPEINYGLFYKGVSFVPRRDGLVFQAVGEDDYYGFNDETTDPSQAEADFAVNTIAKLFGSA
ncbi:MAG: D-amino-acid oxidase [Gammaproteobacteria bacterium]|nr:D-amino-acid oxidase [Gammaproteobacteria bacterium]